MERAILKTLIYADIFDYPLLSHEVHKWLIGKKLSIEQVEKILKRLVKNRKIGFKDGMYFLRGRKELTGKRLQNETISQKYYQKALWIGRIFKLIPWIQLVGISGSLAMRNADKQADIDLFIISRSKRVWLTRLLAALILELAGQRRSREAGKKDSAGKICLNLLLSEEALEQSHNLYMAHEVLQMKVLWDRDKMYKKFLEANIWTDSFLPNWIGMSGVERGIGKTIRRRWKIFDILEKIFETLQIRYMGKFSGHEKVSDQVLYFHPDDIGGWVVKEYQRKTKILSLKLKA